LTDKMNQPFPKVSAEKAPSSTTEIF